VQIRRASASDLESIAEVHIDAFGNEGAIVSELALALIARNVSMKMRHPSQEIKLPCHQSKMGLFIQTASGKAGGLGTMPLNLFECFS